jgi:hypothetical protein
MAPRINKIRHDEETRAKIKTSQLINRLQDHILNDLDLKPTQVTAALGLLKKTIPDLSQSEVTNIRMVAKELSDDELANIAAGSSEGADTAPLDPSQLN